MYTPPPVKMMKRAAEDDGGPPSKQAAAGKGAAAGMRADEVHNPIPRLFSQNSITIHISQRTFEEIGPGSLKWCPTSQYWAAMFDKFHNHMFWEYFKKCSTFEITSPKVRISNILMLQDEQQTAANTPKDVSIFTQACYLVKFSPVGQRNWFKLGTTKDCMGSQKYLTYKPMEASDCDKYITQLVDIGPGVYEDLEKLVLNPAKADETAGWVTNSIGATPSNPAGLDCKLVDALTENINIDTQDMVKDKDYFITESFISPRSPYLGDFSCSVKSCEPHVPLGKHTTYMRNLDKIEFYKYGDEITWNVNTNLDGVKLLNHDANTPFGHVYKRATHGSTKADTEVYTVFCYPSNNRPFYSRQDNLDVTGPVKTGKGFKPLQHHFLTMPPIRKGDGTLIKQRCSFIMEQSVSVTFHFPETVAPDEAEYMLDQRNAVILRPAVVKVIKKKLAESPKTPPPPSGILDPVRERVREVIRRRSLPNFPSIHDVDNWVVTPVGTRTPTVYQPQYRLPASISALCRQLGLDPVCSDMDTIFNAVRGGLPTEIDWNNLPIGLWAAPDTPPPAIDEIEYINDVAVPKVKYDYKININPIQKEEYMQMVSLDNKERQESLFGMLMLEFIKYYYDNKMDEIPYGHVDVELPTSYYQSKGFHFNRLLSGYLKEAGEPTLNEMYENKCTQKIFRWYPRQATMAVWSGRNLKNWDMHANITSEQPVTQNAPMDFSIEDWYMFLYRMYMFPMPNYLKIKELYAKYENCVNQQLDQKLPQIPIDDPAKIQLLKDKGLIPKDTPPTIKRVEPIAPIAFDHYKYDTSVFFV